MYHLCYYTLILDHVNLYATIISKTTHKSFLLMTHGHLASYLIKYHILTSIISLVTFGFPEMLCCVTSNKNENRNYNVVETWTLSSGYEIETRYLIYEHASKCFYNQPLVWEVFIIYPSKIAKLQGIYHPAVYSVIRKQFNSILFSF
jgi:hypothetical protein